MSETQVFPDGGVPSWDLNEAREAELLSKTHADGMADEGILPQARWKILLMVQKSG